MEYVLHVIVMVEIYVVLSISLDLLLGHTGLTSAAHAAFYGIGAYASAILTVRLGASFLLGLATGMGVAIFVSAIMSWACVRLRDDYFVVATLGFQMVLFSVSNNWAELTEGPTGIPGIPSPEIFGVAIRSGLGFVVLGAVLVAIAWLVVGQIVRSPFGRVLHSIREDEIFSEAMGKNILRFKLTAFAVSATLAASAGSLYAHYISYIDPTSFTIMESILVISMVIIGGAGSVLGPVIGAVVLVTLPEALRFVGFPTSVAANLRQIAYGTLLVVMMMARPRGLVGRYAFGR